MISTKQDVGVGVTARLRSSVIGKRFTLTKSELLEAIAALEKRGTSPVSFADVLGRAEPQKAMFTFAQKESD